MRSKISSTGLSGSDRSPGSSISLGLWFSGSYRSLLLFILLLCLSNISIGQKFLSLEKLGKTKRRTYSIGEEIKYKTKSEVFEREDVIVALDYESKLVIFRFDSVKVTDFDYIRITPSRGVFSPSTGLKIAVVGAAYFAIDYINRAWVQGQDYTFDNNSARTSLIIVGTGLFWYSFRKTKFKPGRNKRVRIVDMSPG